MLVKLNIDDRISVEYIPLIKNDSFVNMADRKIADDILYRFRNRSLQILDEQFVSHNYLEFAQKNIDLYIYIINGRRNIVFLALYKFFPNLYMKMLFKQKYKKDVLMAIKDCIQCEAHRELLLSGINQKIIKEL